MDAEEVVLIVDPSEADVRRVAELLADPRRAVHTARTLSDARAFLDERRPDLALVSLELPELPGPRVVRMLKDQHASLRIVALTDLPDPSVAVATIRAGGEDYLGKPVDRARLEQAVGRALREVRAERDLRATRELVRDRYGFHDLLSRSPKMMAVFEQIRAVASTDATVLVLGETGTGKELVARAVHDGSPRRERPYIAVNCGAFAEGLLESELFGHERGSFTGAVDRRVGVFELADGGTLFLDELADTSLATQVNLLRVLEELAFRRVGGEKLVHVDVRIVAAAHEDLPRRVEDGRFRDDLWYRLNVFPIRLPPLRERREDIPVLLRHFLQDAARQYGTEPPRVSADAMARIRSYRWPGNVRQLRALCERWAIVAAGGTLLEEMLPGDLARMGAASHDPGGLEPDPDAPLAPQLDDLAARFERAYLHRVLARHGGHLVRTADHAGISRRTLYTKVRAYGLDPDSYRPSGARDTSDDDDRSRR